MHDKGVNRARAQFYRKWQEGTLTNGTDYYGYRYIPIDYVREAGEYAVGYDRVGFFLGSYAVHTHLNPDGTVTFTVKYPKNLATASKSPFYYAPDLIGFERSEHSLEGLIMGREQFKFPSDIFLASVFEPRRRSDPGPFGSDIHLGGRVDLVFTWTEPLRVDQGR
jgi:hypothetical protein